MSGVLKSLRWDQVYEWSNYRLACSRLNARKSVFAEVLDPFEVEDGWFQLELVSFQVVAAPTLPSELRERVEQTIVLLRLDDFRWEREQIATDYWNNDISLRILQRDSPFVARELARQGRLRAGDEEG